MRIKLFAALLALPLFAAAFAASAQDTPAGRWKTYDEDTGKPRLIVDVYQAKDGSYAAKVVDTLFAPDAKCAACTGDKKDKPIKGMVILWGLRPADAGWSGGTVLDPEKGKTYKSRVQLHDGGRKLGVSGCIAFICRSQDWLREP
jgi:uncharacterized protein (DUF2147 family)